ncbi:MAG: methionine--tRNA ligase subunit beta [Planctomycetota bacterium]|nr:methionine--tRNA ligase subunit beta [Planctomycetota bacterium]MDA1105975.1 methionine--tRNA ligase subunit beta [Planctomycetota bacterium]
MSEAVAVNPGVQGSPLIENIPFDVFAKLDLRVATIVSAEPHPNADKLLKIKLDDGTPDGRQVCAGIKAWYAPEKLVGSQVIIVANLEPRTLRGEVSQGMILAASAVKGDGGERDVFVLRPDAAVPAGSKVS